MDREFKPLFAPRRKGWKMGEADEAQLEFRVAVYLGDDRQGREDVRNNADVHSFTASIVFADSWVAAGASRESPEGDKIRTESKTHTFKPLYGGRSGTPEMVAYYEAFRKKYPDLAQTQEGWTYEVLKNKKLVMPHGFVFYWPDTRMSRSGYISNTTSIYNYPVQHFATAEIVPIGVTYLWHRMRIQRMQSFLVNTVHDSAIGEVHPDEQDLYRNLAGVALSKDVVEYLQLVYQIDFDVPLEAEVSFGDHWAEKKNWAGKWLATKEEKRA
jgi:DNA polymerase I-like protein with 3'-5' exonuclease and polymerase domains